MESDRYYRTISLREAVFLLLNNQILSGINNTWKKKEKEFAFIRSDYLDELVDIYRRGPEDDPRLKVSVHKYERLREGLLDDLMKSRLNQDENEDIKY